MALKNKEIKCYAVLLLCLLPSISFGSEEILEVVKKKILIVRKTDQYKINKKVYVYNNMKLTAVGTIEKCATKICAIKVYKKLKNYSFTKKEHLRLTPYPRPKFAKKEKNQVKLIPVFRPRYGLKFEYGGTLSSAYQVSFWKEITPELSYDFGLEYLNNAISDIKLKGTGLSLGVTHTKSSKNKLKYNYQLSVDISQAQLDFSAVNQEELVKDEYIFQVQITRGAVYSLTTNSSIGVDLGLSLNSLKDAYKNELNDEIKIAFNGFLLHLNFFLKYRF